MLPIYLILAALILGFAKAGSIRSKAMLQESTKIKYIQQNLDHFSFANNRTFKQMYLMNDHFWNSENSGPIFFEIGGEDNFFRVLDNIILDLYNIITYHYDHRKYNKIKVKPFVHCT